MKVVNFSHPLTPAQLQQIENLIGQSVEQVIDVKTQLDHVLPFADQAKAVVESVGLSPQEWQTALLLINLPSFNVVAALVLAELHGRCGYFPAVIRLKPMPNTMPLQFEVAEILNLQAVREQARQQR